jgi:hypothetical protein
MSESLRRRNRSAIRFAVVLPEGLFAGRRHEDAEQKGRSEMRYSGGIVEVLSLGEYGHADIVQVSYDELYDLAKQAELIAGAAAEDSGIDLTEVVERQTKRSLHPALGGEVPYDLDPRMLWELPLQ